MGDGICATERKEFGPVLTATSYQLEPSKTLASAALNKSTLLQPDYHSMDHSMNIAQNFDPAMADCDTLQCVISCADDENSPRDENTTLDMLDHMQCDNTDADATLYTELVVKEGSPTKVIEKRESSHEICEAPGAFYRSKYELRPQGHGYKPGFTSTWMDRDETGDYDPVEERRQLMKRNLKRKLQAKPPKLSSCDSSNEDSTKDQVLPRMIPKLIVKLLFSDKQRLEGTVRPVIQDTAPGYGYSLSGRRLRRRGADIAPNQSCNSSDADLDDQHDRVGHYHGHPAARGCRQCYEIHLRCSLLDDDQAGPCACCDDGETECELITIPKYKAACERCRRRRIICSYTFTADHRESCGDCAATGSHCIAAPIKDSIRPRIRYDTHLCAKDIARFCDGGLSAATLPLQKEFRPRVIFTCEKCNKFGRRCSFMYDTNAALCTSCDMDGAICTREPLTEAVKSPTQASPKHREKLEEELEYDKSQLVSVFVPKIPPPRIQKRDLPDADTYVQRSMKHLTTRFSHPILFNHNISSNSTSRDNICHFCSPEHSAYPLLGVGHQRTIMVHDDPVEPGLIEIKASRHEQTRMCLACTAARISIMSCTSHNMYPIPGIELTTLDFAGAFTNLFASANKLSSSRHDRWCSLCPNLAVRECVAPSGEQGNKHKCGLFLCVTCTVELGSVRIKGNLQALLAILREERSLTRPLGLRADWELLKTNGLVARFVRWNLIQDQKVTTI